MSATPLPHPELDDRPWFRQFWPWFLIFLPASAVVGGLLTVYIAFHHRVSLVNGDYHKVGLAMQEDLSRDHAAAALGVRAEVRLDRAGGPVSIALVTGRDPRPPAHIMLRLTHPTIATLDTDIDLTRGPDGKYHGRLPRPIAGEWTVQVQPWDLSWRLTGELPADASRIHLRPRSVR